MFKQLSLATVLMVSSVAYAEVITDWDLSGNAGNESFVAAASSAANVTGLNMTRGPGLNASNGSNSFSSSGWSLASNDFFSFGFSVMSGYEVDLADLTIALRASNTGPGSLGLFYSGDNFGTNLFTFTQSGTSYNNQIIDLTSLQNLTGNVEFRISAIADIQADGVGTIRNNGTLRISEYFDNGSFTNVQFNGAVSSVAAVPEPQTYAMLLAGLGLLAFASRRQA